MPVNNKYKVEHALLPTDVGGYEKRSFITKDYIPVYEVNAFLEEKSIFKPTTGRKYAYSLVKYLNYLNMLNLSYKEAVVVNVKNYLKWLMYGVTNDLNIHSLNSNLSYSTLNGDITVVTEFYKYLNDEGVENSMPMNTQKVRNTKSFMYGQIFEYDYSKILNKHIGNLSPSKEYVKWYTEDEKIAILSNFKTLRDEAIFSLTLEGMRIDEVLSIQLSDFDDVERIIQPSRSKGRDNARSGNNQLRIIALTEGTADLLNRYINTERATAEYESGKYNDYLFINLRQGKNQGNPVTYHNFLKQIKEAGKRAGLDSKKIRTHSGRSTKVNELLEHQALYPEDQITDFMIKEIMGWKSMDSIEPYKKHDNMTIAKSASEKARRRKEKQ